jgi:hypothetical protein
MAQNKLPDPISELLDLAQRMEWGIAAKGATIGLLQYTVANFGPKRIALDAKQTAFNATRSALAAASATCQQCVADMRAACLDARKILSISFGENWSPEWTAAGWTGSSTAVPANDSALVALCDALVAFFTTNPDCEVSTSKINVTASRFSSLLSATAGAISFFQTKKTAHGTSKDNRTADEKTLRKAMRGLIDVLNDLIPPLSPIWDAFGLNQPGATVTPDRAAVPTLTKVSEGKVLAQVPPVPLTTYYRWMYQLVGVDENFRFAGRTSDPMIELTDQPATGTLLVKAFACNTAGAGKASPVATIELGPPSP